MKALVVVCGQEKVKPRNDDVIKYNFQASASNEKTSKELSEIFEVDITETL